MILFFLIPLFACWGSFLNVVGYRLINGINIVTPRSHCTQCKHQLAWYDLIPIFSWLILFGKCKYCSQPISWLYPFIEILTTIALSILYISISTHYFFAYFVFFSTLIVTIRTDLQYMLISSFMTLYLIPFGFLWSYFNWLPISLTNSFAGTLLGYGFLWITTKVFYYVTGKHGMGEGDFELLAFIGAFTGALGCWMSLLIGSVIGSIIGVGLLSISKLPFILRSPTKLYAKSGSAEQREVYRRIPFGPFLAIGAMIYVIWQEQLITLLLKINY